MLPSRVRQSLQLAQVVAAATLVRSVAYERWITVLVAALLLFGAAAAQRGKTWGVGVSLAAASAYLGAWWLGIAPAWFCLVAMTAALPFAVTWRPLARFDGVATAIVAASAAAAGALGAVVWKGVAWFLFDHVQMLAPTWRLTTFSAVAAGMAAVGAVLVLGRTSFASGVSQHEGAGRAGIRVNVPRSPAAASLARVDDDAGWDDLDAECCESATAPRRTPRSSTCS